MPQVRHGAWFELGNLPFPHSLLSLLTLSTWAVEFATLREQDEASLPSKQYGKNAEGSLWARPHLNSHHLRLRNKETDKNDGSKAPRKGLGIGPGAKLKDLGPARIR